MAKPGSIHMATKRPMFLFASLVTIVILILSESTFNLPVAAGRKEMSKDLDNGIDTLDVDLPPARNDSSVRSNSVVTPKVTKHKITSDEISSLKKTVGVYEEGRNYNQIVSGPGTGLRPPTEEEWKKIYENLFIIDEVAYQSLPLSNDQSKSPWFPPIGNQGSQGSCAAFAVAYYFKTFQEAKEHNWDLKGASWLDGITGHPTESFQDRIMSPAFVYNLENGGDINGGSSSYINMLLISSIGVCSWSKMPYNVNTYTNWPTEEAWEEATLYRGANLETPTIDFSTDLGLTNLKSWISAGNLAVISINSAQFTKTNLGQSDIWTLDKYTLVGGGHAGTVVGYDDNISYYEQGQLRSGAFKIANSWGVGDYDWENVVDGFYWISYAAMRQRVKYSYISGDRIDYKPELTATFRINHTARNECSITIGLGNPILPQATKSFSEFIRAGSLPFCSNNIIFDITEFKNLVPSVYNQSFYLNALDAETIATGSISKFSIENTECTTVPIQTINNKNVYLNLTLKSMNITWPDETLLNTDQDGLDNKISTASDSFGNFYLTYIDRSNNTASFTSLYVKRSSDGGKTWTGIIAVGDTTHNLGYPSMSIDPYTNNVYIAVEREWNPSDHDILLLCRVNGTWTWKAIANTANSDERFPSITCEYQYGSDNRLYVSYEYVYNSNDRDLMFAKSTDKGSTWNITKLHGSWPDDNVYAQTSITNAQGNIYMAYKYGADYNSICEIRVERSTNFGGSWTQITNVDGLPMSSQFPSIVATHGGSSVLVAFEYLPIQGSTMTDVYYSYSSDNGSTWIKGISLFSSGSAKSIRLAVDGEGTEKNSVAGNVYAVCKDGLFAKYRKTLNGKIGSWSTAEIISDNWIGEGFSLSTRTVNGTSLPFVVWSDLRTKDLYFSSIKSVAIVLTGVNVISGGTGYTTPVVFLMGGGGKDATATARVSNGVIYAIVLTNPGSGYMFPPTLILSDPSPRAQGATATVVSAIP